jgi:peptidoglycan-associated lipoprotein
MVMIMRAPRIWMASFAGAALLCAPLPALWAQAQAGQPVVLEVSEELLQDGIDALKDRRPDLARKIFQNLLASHPRSSAANKAAVELAKLEHKRDPGASRGDAAGSSEGDSEGDSSERPDSERPGAEVAEQIRKLRFRLVSEVGDRVFFAESSAVIGGRARAILEAQARWLKRSQSLGVTIIGRADDGGSSADAMALAQQRAEVVRAKLIEAGISSERIKIETRGNSDPVATCRTAICQAQNRHAETLLRFSGKDEASSGLTGVIEAETQGAEALGGDSIGADVGHRSGQALAR